jgi:hypothetical protein
MRAENRTSAMQCVSGMGVATSFRSSVSRRFTPWNDATIRTTASTSERESRLQRHGLTARLILAAENQTSLPSAARKGRQSGQQD